MSIKKMNFFYSTGRLEDCKTELKKILNEAKRNDLENLSEIYTLLSNDERYKGNLDKSLAYSLEAVKYLDVAKNKIKITTLSANWRRSMKSWVKRKRVSIGIKNA